MAAAVTFTFYNTAGNPDNLGNEDFVLMGSSWGFDHLWNDDQSSWDAAFFVEYEPLGVPETTPFAMTIACVALFAVLRYSRNT